MPVIATAAAARAAGSGRLKAEHVLIVAVALAGVVALWMAAARRTTGGVKAPAKTEDVPAFTPPPQAPTVGPEQHIGGVVFSPHRYPARCGGEISALIHHGHAVLRIPRGLPDGDWMTRPPSEEQL